MFYLFSPIIRQLNFFQSFKKKNDPVPRKRLHRQTDGRHDRWADSTLYDPSDYRRGSKKRP